MAKRAKEERKVEKKVKKKKKKREEAKRAMEMLYMDSPVETSDEESSDDNSRPVPSPRLNRITDTHIPSPSKAIKRAMEYIDSCSDLEVKNLAREDTRLPFLLKELL